MRITYMIPGISPQCGPRVASLILFSSILFSQQTLDVGGAESVTGPTPSNDPLQETALIKKL